MSDTPDVVPPSDKALGQDADAWDPFSQRFQNIEKRNQMSATATVRIKR